MRKENDFRSRHQIKQQQRAPHSKSTDRPNCPHSEKMLARTRNIQVCMSTEWKKWIHFAFIFFRRFVAYEYTCVRARSLTNSLRNSNWRKKQNATKEMKKKKTNSNKMAIQNEEFASCGRTHSNRFGPSLQCGEMQSNHEKRKKKNWRARVCQCILYVQKSDHHNRRFLLFFVVSQSLLSSLF